MLDLFQPPKVTPRPTRIVCDMPDFEAEKRQQRMDAIRKAQAARSKDGKVRFGLTREEKLARRRELDAVKRKQAIGTAAHEALKAQKRANYHALTAEQREAKRAYQREWWARKQGRCSTDSGDHETASKSGAMLGNVDA